MIRISAILLLVLALAACGGGGGGGGSAGAPAAATATLHYPSGAVQARGPVDAQGRKQGRWTVRFEQGGEQWTAVFTDDAFDPSQPWVERNADGSVRFDHSDGPPPNRPLP